MHSLEEFGERLFGLNNIFDNFTPEGNYPPYNIYRKTENINVLEMAVAGFAKEDLEVTIHEGELIISGSKQEKAEVEYLHMGLAFRKFKKIFTLTPEVKANTVTLKDGILRIELEQVAPEKLQPKKLEIQ